MRKLYVVAGNYEEFKNYCFQNGIRLDGTARFIHRAEQLEGLSFDRTQVRLIGTWFNLVEAFEIRQQLEQAEARTVATNGR